MLTGLLRCCAAPAILSPPFAYREASLRFYAHVGRVSRSCTPLCKHRRARTFRPYKHKKVPGKLFPDTQNQKRRQINLHPPLWNMHQSSIETDTSQNQRGGLLARGQPPGLPSQLSPMAIDHSSPLQQQGLPQIHTAFPFPFDLFSFFPFRGKTGSTPSIAHQKQNARTFCHFIFHEPEGIFMSNFLSPS